MKKIKEKLQELADTDNNTGDYHDGYLQGLNDAFAVVKNNDVLPIVSRDSSYVIALNDDELRIIAKKELDEMYESAIKFDGFLGFVVKGRLI